MASIARAASSEIQSLITVVGQAPQLTTAAAAPQIQAASEPEAAPPADWGSAPETAAPPVDEPAAPPVDERAAQPEQGPVVDTAGQVWDANLHSGGKTKIQNGTWKKRKGGPANAKTAAAQPAAETERSGTDPELSGADQLGDVLNKWG